MRKSALTVSDGKTAEAFARNWIDDWNARRIDEIVAHYAEDGVFISPRALAATGSARVTGRSALMAYWGSAPERFPDLHFDFERCLWDGSTRALVVFYRSSRNGRSVRAAELMCFNDQGLITFGEAMYGAESYGREP